MAIATPLQIRFERFGGDIGIAPAKPPPFVAAEDKPALLERARALLEERDAVLVAHYYVHPDLQDLAQSSGGTVSDSLEMARFGHEHPAKTVVVAGVRFMGETAKILNPEKRVLMPDLAAECSLDLADAVGSPTGIIQAAERLGAKEYIVATDGGIIHQMRKRLPGVNFIEAPTAGKGATCQSCAHCPWMAMNGLRNLIDTLEGAPGHEVLVDPEIGRRAKIPIERMLDFAKKALPTFQGSGDA